MVNKKIVIICSIIAFIVVASIVAIQIKKFEEEQINLEKTAQSTKKNTTNTQNAVENTNQSENTVQENEKKEEQNTEANVTGNTQVQGQEESESEQEGKNSQETALELAKKEWGEDSTVYYTIDNQTNNIYYISVRSKTTTQTLAEYEVNIEQETVKIK